VGTKDLLNPEWEPVDAARFIRDVRVTTTSLGTVNGHASASGGFPADVDFLNREISAFFDLVTARGEKLCWGRCKEPRKQVQSLTGISQAATQRSPAPTFVALRMNESTSEY
jgi:hypothetical protein